MLKIYQIIQLKCAVYVNNTSIKLIIFFKKFSVVTTCHDPFQNLPWFIQSLPNQNLP